MKPFLRSTRVSLDKEAFELDILLPICLNLYRDSSIFNFYRVIDNVVG